MFFLSPLDERWDAPKRQVITIVAKMIKLPWSLIKAFQKTAQKTIGLILINLIINYLWILLFSELDELNKTLQKLEVNIQLICTGYQLNTIKDQWTTVASIAASGFQKAHHYTAFSLMFSITTGSNKSLSLK